MKSQYLNRICILLCCLFGGFACAPKENINSCSYFKESSKLYEEYLSVSINHAENSLWKLIKVTKYYSDRKVEGLDYPILLSFLYIRLHLVNECLGNRKKSLEYKQIGAEYYAKGRKYTNADVQRLIDFIKKIDPPNRYYVRTAYIVK